MKKSLFFWCKTFVVVIGFVIKTAIAGNGLDRSLHQQANVFTHHPSLFFFCSTANSLTAYFTSPTEIPIASATPLP